MGNCLSSILSALFSSSNDSQIKREYTPVNNVNSSISTEKLNSYDFVSSMHAQSAAGEILKPISYNSINDNDYSSSAITANSQHVYSSQNDASFSSGPSTASYNSSQYQHSQGFSNSDNRVNIQLSPPVTTNGTGYNSTTHMSIPAPTFYNSSAFTSKPKLDSGAVFSTKYDLRDEVGVGSTSKCYKCIRKSDGKEFACKVIDKRNVEMKFSGLLDQFFVEIKVLQTLNHPNIIRLEDTSETPDRIFMVMEMMKGGELFDYVVEKGTLSEEEASILVRKITSAVAHMHSLNIIHRDLKPENLLLTAKANNNSNINTNNNAGKLVVAGNAEVLLVPPNRSLVFLITFKQFAIIGETDRLWTGQGNGRCGGQFLLGYEGLPRSGDAPTALVWQGCGHVGSRGDRVRPSLRMPAFRRRQQQDHLRTSCKAKR